MQTVLPAQTWSCGMALSSAHTGLVLWSDSWSLHCDVGDESQGLANARRAGVYSDGGILVIGETTVERN